MTSSPPFPRTRADGCEVLPDLVDGAVALLLPTGDITLIDPPFFAAYASWRWTRRSSAGYVAISKDGVRHDVHRLVATAAPEQMVHHKNGAPLDNCAANLAGCRAAENAQRRMALRPNARSCYRGVSADTRNGLWRAEIEAFGERFYLGRFRSERAAAHAYDDAAMAYLGREWRVLNFPGGHRQGSPTRGLRAVKMRAATARAGEKS